MGNKFWCTSNIELFSITQSYQFNLLCFIFGIGIEAMNQSTKPIQKNEAKRLRPITVWGAIVKCPILLL